jgi:NADH pyrophosphatase NudC (nudix superfamily)
MKTGAIRPIAIGIFRSDERILVAEGYDPLKEQVFYRPLGGTIEFGERGHKAVVRELREELGAEATNLRYLCTLENIFTYNGQPGHEIVLVYEGELTDKSFYNRERLEACEDDGAPFVAVWKRLEDFGSHAPLYPDGLPELLRAELEES